MAAHDAGLYPGPIDPSVLYAQHMHRSETVWYDGDESVLYCRRDDGYIARDDDVLLLREIHAFGFYGLYQLSYTHIDRAMVTALVERWRLETHTFHMPTGEMTVTLQDVEVIGGIAVDGVPVTGVDSERTVAQWQDIVEELLGFRPAEEFVNGNWLRISAIHTHMRGMPAEADGLLLTQYARCVIMMMIGGHYLSDKSGNYVFLVYLELLRDPETSRSLSWGSAYWPTCTGSCAGRREGERKRFQEH